MKEKDKVRAAATGGKKKTKKKRILLLSTAGVLIAALTFLFLHLYYCPLNYLWVKFSNPEISARREGELRVHFVDVGQGDAVIVEFPDGKTMLVDGGSESYESRSALLRYANALGAGPFDYLILTHPDSDHAGGMDDVIECFGAEKAYIPYIMNYGQDSSFASFLEELAGAGCETEISQTYEAVLAENRENFYYFMFLSPFAPGVAGSYYDAANQEGATDTDINNASAVVWLEYAGRSLLLTGDIASEVEEKLAADYGILGSACFEREFETAWGEKMTLAPALDRLDFLKAAHHGSAASSSETFLRLTSPAAAFISSGAGNPYGHPAQETVKRLTDAGAQIYRTDELGSIVLTIAKDGTYAIDAIGR